MSTLFTLISIGAIAYWIFPLVFNKSEFNWNFPYNKVVGPIGVVILVFTWILVKVGGQEVGVIISPQGIDQHVLKTGWHLVMPWNTVYKMDRTVWVYSFTNAREEGQKKYADAIWTPTKDGIKMGIDISISWRIDPEQAWWIYQNVSEADGGHDGRYIWIEENIIRPKTKSALALTISNFTPIEVYSNKRQDIQNVVMSKLKDELNYYHLLLEQVDIREVFYSPEYETSINAKKLAEQEVLRLIEVTKQKTEQLKQAEIDKNIAIQRAEGESRALQIKGQSISNNPKIIQLEWINKWDGKLPMYMMSDKQGVIVDLKDK